MLRCRALTGFDYPADEATYHEFLDAADLSDDERAAIRHQAVADGRVISVEVDEVVEVPDWIAAVVLGRGLAEALPEPQDAADEPSDASADEPSDEEQDVSMNE